MILKSETTEYKYWMGFLTGYNPPVATVEADNNTLGGTIVWSRVADGTYKGTLAGAFPAFKFFCPGVTYKSTNDSSIVSLIMYRLNNNEVILTGWNLSSNAPMVDGDLSDAPLAFYVFD